MEMLKPYKKFASEDVVKTAEPLVAIVNSPLHPGLQPLAFLVGIWRGRGNGYYPTVEKFCYEEEVSFQHVGKPFLAYTQRTWSTNEAKTPMHTESGFIRLVPPSKLEFVVCDPTGNTQIYEGEVDEARERIELHTTQVGLTATAKEVKAVSRTLWCTKNEETGKKYLNYELSMAAVGQEMQRHLDASLEQMTEKEEVDTQQGP